MNLNNLRVAFVSNYPSPYMVKFVDELRRYIDFEAFYYEELGIERPEYWKIPRSKHNTVLDNVYFKKQRKYFTFDLTEKLNAFSPDIVIIGGLGIISNYFAYRWAKKNKRKVILFSEFKRNKDGNQQQAGLKINVLKRLYKRGFDGVFAVGQHGFEYFNQVFNFQNVIQTIYPIDLEICLKENRPAQLSERPLKIIYPHRLEPIYSPAKIFTVIDDLTVKYGRDVSVFVPSYGSLFAAFKEEVAKSKYSRNITFLDDIKEWDDVGRLYNDMHFSISPCDFSNGNMAIVEAMASGVVCLVTREVLFNSGLIRENGGGKVVNVGQMAEEINAYIENKEAYLESSAQARKIAARYSVENIAKEWVENISIVNNANN